MDVIVLGLGNLLLADEGVGVHAARALMARGGRYEGIVYDVGTAVLNALEPIAEAKRIIMVDAFKAGGRPGTIYRLPFSSCAPAQRIASMHGFDMSRVLAMAQNRLGPQVTVIGVEPKKIEWSLSLSQDVARVMPLLLKVIEEEVFHGPSGDGGVAGGSGDNSTAFRCSAFAGFGQGYRQVDSSV